MVNTIKNTQFEDNNSTEIISETKNDSLSDISLDNNNSLENEENIDLNNSTEIISEVTNESIDKVDKALNSKKFESDGLEKLYKEYISEKRSKREKFDLGGFLFEKYNSHYQYDSNYGFDISSGEENLPSNWRKLILKKFLYMVEEIGDLEYVLNNLALSNIGNSVDFSDVLMDTFVEFVEIDSNANGYYKLKNEEYIIDFMSKLRSNYFGQMLLEKLSKEKAEEIVKSLNGYDSIIGTEFDEYIDNEYILNLIDNKNIIDYTKRFLRALSNNKSFIVYSELSDETKKELEKNIKEELSNYIQAIFEQSKDDYESQKKEMNTYDNSIIVKLKLDKFIFDFEKDRKKCSEKLKEYEEIINAIDFLNETVLSENSKIDFSFVNGEHSKYFDRTLGLNKYNFKKGIVSYFRERKR